jgi:hypothetical protein
MFVYENLRTSIDKSALLIPGISVYALELHEDMQIKAAVGAGMTTFSTWTTLGTRPTKACSKVPPAAFYGKIICFNFVMFLFFPCFGLL